MDQESFHGGQACWPRSYSTLNYDRFSSYDIAVTRSKASIWIQLWRKFKKEKEKLFKCPNSMRTFTYDPCSYSQNFDDRGAMWTDSDDLSRSFSARFAVPSRIFDNNKLMV